MPTRAGLMAAGIMMMANVGMTGLAAQAQTPGIDAIVVADTADATSSQQSFAQDTAKIVVQARVPNAPPGTKVSAVWIAEKTEVAPPDYHIVSTDFTLNGSGPVAVFSLTKPTAGWPAGNYRVELSIDGAPAGKVAFKIG